MKGMNLVKFGMTVGPGSEVGRAGFSMPVLKAF
jgi:hypothetical protein